MHHEKRLALAVQLMPAFAFKFDYSSDGSVRPDEPDHFHQLARLALKAADALWDEVMADAAKETMVMPKEVAHA